VVTIAIMLIMAAMAVPLLQSAMRDSKLRSSVASVTGAIQYTRYRAIAAGYPYAIVFNKANSTYQIQSDPNLTGTFTNVGGTVPLSGSSTVVALGQDTTLQFHPGGVVQATTGATTLTLTYGGKTESITVSRYGNINVTP
jgi:Tfp pilus assembly protein FimT